MEETKIDGMRMEEVNELCVYAEEFMNWDEIEAVSEIDKELTEKNICRYCGNKFNGLEQVGYESNIDPERGNESFGLACPNCKEILAVEELQFY